jgi:hypothetical protein
VKSKVYCGYPVDQWFLTKGQPNRILCTELLLLLTE